MVENGIFLRRHAKTLASVLSGRAILVLGVALALAACAAPSAWVSDGIENAGAYVKTAAGDIEKVAGRARAYHSANVRKRAAREVEEAEVIQRKARDARERIRRALEAATAEMEEWRAKILTDEFEAGADESGYVRDYYSDAGAAERVERISAILMATDRHMAKIEQMVAALQKLEIPGRR
jgi:hypothetical protein